VSHALFKSFLFLKIGFFIFYDLGTQDSRLGKNKNFRFLFYIGFIIRLFSLFALFFIGGIMTKDFFLELFFNSSKNFFLIFFGLFYLLLTFF